MIMKYERNYFTDTQIEELTRSNWVKSVSEANVTFTEDFKKEFIHDYRNGIGPKQIIRNHGIDPVILGKRRIDCLTARIKTQSARPEGFARKENSSKGKIRKKQEPTFQSKEEEAAYYKSYSKQLEQELDFAKKMRALEAEYSQSVSGAGKRK
jgi:hypothetical protein